MSRCEAVVKGKEKWWGREKKTCRWEAAEETAGNGRKLRFDWEKQGMSAYTHRRSKGGGKLRVKSQHPA